MTPTIKRPKLPENLGLYWRGNVLWCKVYERGKPVFRSTGTSSVEEAKRFSIQLRAKAGRGEIAEEVTMRGVLISELIKDERARMDRECKPSTVRWANRAFDTHILPAFGPLPAADLTTDILESYQNKRREAGVEKSSINNELALLRSALFTAYRRTPPKIERVLSFPMYPKSQLTVRTGFLEWSEYEKLVELIEPSLKALIVVLYHLGLRKGEALSLRWDQVEFPTGGRMGLIRLNPLETKNLEARTCPMYGDLLAYLTRQKEIRDRLYPAQPYVFFWMPDSYAPAGQPGGNHVTPGTAIGGSGHNFKAPRSWVEAVASIGKPDLVMHDMRRSAVRNMIERAGMSAKQAMVFSGHKTQSMVERYHILGRGELEAAATKLEAMYQGNRSGGPEPPAPAPAAVYGERSDVYGGREAAPGGNVISFSDLLQRKAARGEEDHTR